MNKRDERRDPREGLTLPVNITWQDPTGNQKQASGTTRNISSSGAFIVCDNLIGKDCEIRLAIDRPVALAQSIRSLVSARGRVVRDVPDSCASTGYGHGIMFDYFTFTRL